MIDGIVRWSMVFVRDNIFPWLRPRTAEVRHTYSASHQKPLRLNPSQQRWKTDVENTSSGYKEHRKKTHTDMFFIDWTQVMWCCPRYANIHTHRDTECSWFSAYIMHFPSPWYCTVIFPRYELWSARMIDIEVRVGAAGEEHWELQGCSASSTATGI